MRPPLRLWFAATRPAFLSVTIVGVLLGLACAAQNGQLRSFSLALFTLLFALIAHAGANVINDYYDALSGCDAANVNRIYPFTGGSRFIQNGQLTPQQTAKFGYLLLVLVIPAGLWLVMQSGPWLLVIGFLGLFCGWAYSSPPCKLQSRGLGEIAITLAWLAVVLGTYFVQSRILSSAVIYAGLAYAPLVANVLFVNQIPDRIADAQASKNTLIVYWGHQFAPWGSLGLYLTSLFILLWAISSDALSSWSALALLAIFPAGRALIALFRNPADQRQLCKAIPATIISTLAFGLLLALGQLI